MNKRIVEIALEDAVAGMELGADLIDARGTVLLQKGSALSGSLLTVLGRRGVERVRVLGDALEAAGPELAAARERAGARLASLFRQAEGEAARTLRGALEAYRLELTG